MPETLYPIGYGSEHVTLAELKRREGDGMHPEYARRFWAWIESLGGEVGVGDGWRPTPSPTSEASRLGKSFHQTQVFASGFLGWCAVDCVAKDGPDANNSHDGMTAELAATAVPYGLHANIGTPGQMGYEAWHIQPIEIDGFDSWAKLRLDPVANYPLPGTPPPPPPPEKVAVKRIIINHTVVKTAFNEDGTIISDDVFNALDMTRVQLVDSDHEQFLAMACEVNGPAVAYDLGKRAERFK